MVVVAAASSAASVAAAAVVARWKVILSELVIGYKSYLDGRSSIAEAEGQQDSKQRSTSSRLRNRLGFQKSPSKDGTKVSLRQLPFSNRIASAFAGGAFRELEEFNLGGNPIGDAGVADLVGRTLYESDAKVPCVGIAPWRRGAVRRRCRRAHFLRPCVAAGRVSVVVLGLPALTAARSDATGQSSSVQSTDGACDPCSTAC